MSCLKLMRGFDADTCEAGFNKYYQNIVLINKEDVDSFNITSNNDTHKISFSLKEGRSGVLFRAPEVGSSLIASWSKSTDNGVPVYEHSASLPIIGVGQNVKSLLKQLDQANVFAAIQFKDNTIEVLGFNYGMVTQDYDFQAQSGIGGSIISIKSREREYDPPYVYTPADSVLIVNPNQAVEDFDNLFANIDSVDTGDFNNDFSNDFDII